MYDIIREIVCQRKNYSETQYIQTADRGRAESYVCECVLYEGCFEDQAFPHAIGDDGVNVKHLWQGSRQANT